MPTSTGFSRSHLRRLYSCWKRPASWTPTSATRSSLQRGVSQARRLRKRCGKWTKRPQRFVARPGNISNAKVNSDTTPSSRRREEAEDLHFTNHSPLHVGGYESLCELRAEVSRRGSTGPPCGNG